VAHIYLSLGSNIDRHARINAALDALLLMFGDLQLSPVYESDSVGFAGDNFFNLVVGITTNKSIGEVSAILKHIENENGRDRSAPRFGPRSLDIDILTVDDICGAVDGIQLPREEVLVNAFVLLPLADIAPDRVHPQTGKTYEHHWQEYDQSKQKLWAIEFIWLNRPA
jgi:2-amino-4-hydroxy-6-hydroxymethyldihydropteridine diphosphokinase